MKRILCSVAVLVMTAMQPAFGQGANAGGQAPAVRAVSAADLQAITDAKIGIIKAALQLTGDQTKFWGPLEEAIRNRAAGRQKRLAALQAKLEEGDVDLLVILQERADNLIARGTDLKRVVDAWRPLVQTLTPEQKDRLALYASHFLNMLRDAAEARQQLIQDEDEE
jgi:hypothetical protein